MKNLFCILFLALSISVNAQVAINTDGTLPDNSAMLEVKSTTKGLLIPRMTQAERDVIVNPATGLMIYQMDNSPGFYYNSGTSGSPAWVIAGTGSGWGLTGNSGTSVGANFIGTTDLVPLKFKVNNQKAGYVDFDEWAANTCFGFQTLNLNTIGYYNTAFGFKVLSQNTAGIYNTAIGFLALQSNITGDANSAIGAGSLLNNTGGSSNTANGFSSLNQNTTGNSNTAIGSYALNENVIGHHNSANGSNALFYNTTGNNNTASGSSALRYNSVGDDNTGNGYEALYSNSNGNNNTASGSSALRFNSGGHGNTGNGHEALFDNTTGSANTACGSFSLQHNITGDYNSAFGRSAFFNAEGLSNTTCIGFNAGGAVNANNRIEIGNTSVSNIVGQVGFGTYSDTRIKDNIKEDVPGLAFINQLRPVTYNLNIHRQNEMVYKGTKKDEDNWDSKYDIELIRMTGFVAQEVEKAANESGYDFSGVQKPANPDELYSLRYSDFVMPLVKAVQELAKKNEELLNRIEVLEKK